MPLKDRILRVNLEMPNGNFVVLTEELFLKIGIQKAALALQNRAVIDVGGMSTVLREELLSQFTAWNKRLADEGEQGHEWVNVTVEAGYLEANTITSTVIFKGQVAQVDLVSPPPNIIVRLTCFTRQIDKTKNASEPAPAQTTFYNFVKWAAQQMGFGDNFICETSYNDVTVYNPARSMTTLSALLIRIQDQHAPDVVAFVDDDLLIVKDRNKVINPSSIAKVTEFIGVPSWNEWGVEFQTLFDPNVRLAQASELESKMNPSVNQQYVITELQYDLASRDVPFYVKASGSPPA